MSIKMYL